MCSLDRVHRQREDDSSLIRLFSTSIFLYPLAAASHTLYLIPQVLLVLGIIWRLRIARVGLRPVTCLVIAFTLGAMICALVVEITVSEPGSDLVSKLVVNGMTLCLVAMSGQRIVSDRTIQHLCMCVVGWAVIALGAYVVAHTTFESLVLVLVTSSDSIDSSQLYNFASPLEAVFLNKNITSMFIVAVFAMFLSLSLIYRNRVSKPIMILFMLTIAIYLSRQAILASFMVLVIYRLITGITIRTAIFALVGIGLAVLFFLTFFDLESSNDGASQRLQLWSYFFEHVNEFLVGGMGVNALNDTLNSAVGIDNFHMFFMNQIGAFGLLHFLLFSGLSLTVLFVAVQRRPLMIMFCAFYLNVLFQTYGYEYGNLFLFMVIVSPLGLFAGRRGNASRSRWRDTLAPSASPAVSPAV